MNYYAVERSKDHLTHYGIKGMKWGVRKAIERGNNKALTRQFNKAQKKLEKLNAKADIAQQTENAKKHNRRARIAAGIGVAGLSSSVGNKILAKHLAKVEDLPLSNIDASYNIPIKASARQTRILGEGKGIEKVGEGLGTGPVGNRGTDRILVEGGRSTSAKPNAFRTIGRLAKATAVAGLGTAAYQKSRALAAKYRTSDKGHAKAVAKRDAWKREIRDTFKGTKYDASKRRRKK